MQPLLQAIKDYATAHDLSGKDVLVTGYSLGGAIPISWQNTVNH